MAIAQFLRHSVAESNGRAESPLRHEGGPQTACGFPTAAQAGAHGALYRVSKGSTRKLADLQEYELQNNSAGDGTAEGSDPFDLARLPGGKTLIADAAGNDLLVADETGNIDWIATFPEQNGEQAVPTSVVIGPDGSYYVGELTGFPATPGLSRVWRVAPGTLHAHCGTSSACSVVTTGLPSTPATSPRARARPLCRTSRS